MNANKTDSNLLKQSIDGIFRISYKNIPVSDRHDITTRLVRVIIEREQTGEYFSKKKVETELIPFFTRSYIRHRKTGYDDLIDHGTPKWKARKMVANYVDQLYKWWSRK